MPPIASRMAVTRRTLLLTAAVAAISGRAQAQSRPKLVAFGDSLTAGYGLPAGQGFAPRLQGALDAAGFHVEVIDAGLSGDTTGGGLARLDWSVPEDAKAVIVELGANDALRGQPPETTRRNLDAIVARLTGRGQKVLVAGMLAPRNLGPDFGRAFDPIFAEVATTHDALLYPFFLDGVALDAALTLRDGLHPNAAGVRVIVERILPSVRQLLARAGLSPDTPAQ